MMHGRRNVKLVFEFSQFSGFLTSYSSYLMIHLLHLSVLFLLMNFYSTLATCCYYLFAYKK